MLSSPMWLFEVINADFLIRELICISRKIQYSELQVVIIVRNTVRKYSKKNLLFLLREIVWLVLQKLIFMASRTDYSQFRKLTIF